MFLVLLMIRFLAPTANLDQNKKISIEKSIFYRRRRQDKKSANFYDIDFCLRLTGDNKDLIDSTDKI